VSRKSIEGHTIKELRGVLSKRPKETVFWENLIAISSLPLADYETKDFSITTPQKIHFQVTRLPVRGVEELPLGHVTVLHDVTREKEAEEMKSNFVSIASHQLRTPLSEIKWALATILNQEVGPLTDTQKTLVAKTHTTNDYLIRLVSDLLDVSRIEEGRFGYIFEPVKLYDVVKEAFDEFLAAAPRKQLSLTLEKPIASFPAVSADLGKLRIALSNVIDNAIKYTPKGFVRITLKSSPKMLSCVVEDTGIGIPKDQQKFIFQKFFRARNAVRVQTEGSGLGLWIANEIMNRHKGTITVKSEENKGSIFSLNFPIDPKEMPRGRVEGP